MNAFARTSLFTLAAMIVALGAPALGQHGGGGSQGAAGQQMGQQQQSAQQQAAQQQALEAQQRAQQQLDQSFQRLQRLEQHAQAMSKSMAQRLAAGGGGAAMGDRDRAMQQLCDSVANLAGDMTRAMDRVHQQLQDPAVLQDRDMKKDMDRLRLHIDDKMGPLEDALKTMDRIQDRLHQPTSPN